MSDSHAATVASLPLEAKAAVLRTVGDALRASPSFRELPPARRERMDRELSDILGFVGAEPSPLAEAAAEPRRVVASTRAIAPLRQQGGGAGRVSGNAVRTGVRQFGQLVKTVDFPRFVSELIEGVFTSIVDSTIRQMEAYAELVASVTKSVEQFAGEHIDDEQARDYLQSSFPDALTRDTGSDSGLLALKDGFDSGQMPDFAAFLGEGAPEEPTDEVSEGELVRRAKLKLARSRQQQLATMVLLGINRIIVTNGQINAKVVFDVEATEFAEISTDLTRHDERSLTDEQTRSFTGEFSGSASSSSRRGDDEDYDRRNSSGKFKLGFDNKRSQVRTRVSTLDAETHRKGTEEITAKAQLTGEVRLNFRSETFPLDRIADTGGLDILSAKAAPEPTNPPQSRGEAAGRGTPPPEGA